jgi:eukaryotic-like serine/threonine-protein kinase
MQIWTPDTLLQKGRYIIKQNMTRGGYGETYLAEDTEQNRLVVIKTLNRGEKEKPDFENRQEKFRQEALILSKCYNSHIIPIDDNFLENGLWAIAMEYIQGDNLETYLTNYVAKNGYLSETVALDYIDQIGQALECVHEQGLLHNNLKPDNILLRRESKEAILIDFGLAREFPLTKISSITATTTEGYAPIEQYQSSRDFGDYTDVYGLAAILYTLLTAKVPISAHALAETGYLLPNPQAQFNPKISDKVNTAILKGMELEPVNRPQTVGELREILGLVVKSAINIPIVPSVNLDIQQPINVETFHGTSLHTPPINQKVQLQSSSGINYSILFPLQT